MEIRRRTPAEVRAYLESQSAELMQLLPNPAEREAFVEATVAAAAHPRERIPPPAVIIDDPTTAQAVLDRDRVTAWWQGRGR